MKIFIKFFIKYLILIGYAFLFEIFFNSLTHFVFLNLLENIFFALVLICPLYFFNNIRFKAYYFSASYLVFSFCLYFEIIYYYLFQTFFSSSAIFVTLDSNADESKEFLSFYIDTPIIIFSLIFIGIIIFVIYTSKKHFNKIPQYLKLTKFRMVFLFLGLIVFIRQSKLINFNLPYLALKSGLEYYTESKKLGNYKNNKLGNFDNVRRLGNPNDNEVYVVILGESTSRSHMGIYDYHRETTPKLGDVKNELLIYNDVISPHAYSVGALTKILTMGNYENPELISSGSIIQLINKAGFETYWLSNQRPIGPYESMITKISLSSKNYEFLTTTVAGNSLILDGELIEEYDKVIKNDVQKKVIFIHMMGTHHHYENRYPESFNVFKDVPKTNFKSEESFKKINHYDNAILYNDFVISEVIRKLDSLSTKSFALYFSDHAEEMYSSLNMAGHNEDIYSKQMFEIPFFLWQSQKFKHNKELFFTPDRRYMTDDLFHSIADLLSISAKQVDTSRSIFNMEFKERKRIIKDTIDYDTYFK